MNAALPVPQTVPQAAHAARTLAADHLSVAYGTHEVVHDLSLALPAGKVTVVIGANASGKSTLLKALARLLPPAAGRVTLDGRDVAGIPRRHFARMVGLLPQAATMPETITVADLVSRGRYPHRGPLSRWKDSDQDAVVDALRMTRTADLADREVGQLSGGQRQRVWIAMVLAQDPDILLLDEPTTYLDLSHQLEVLDVLHRLNRDHGTTVAMVLHDLNLAARYADHLVVMRDGRIICEGPPTDVLTSDVVQQAFSLESTVIVDPVTGSPLVVPRDRRSDAAATAHPATTTPDEGEPS